MIQARAQNSPLAKLPKPISPGQTTASTAATSTPESRRRSKKKGREVALPPMDSHVPREEVENVMESLGIICYCVVGIYACVFQMFGCWVVHLLLNPVLAAAVGVALWGVAEVLRAACSWLVGR